MKREALRDAKYQLARFWAFHRAYTGARSEEGKDKANEYLDSLREFIHGPPPPLDPAEVNRMFSAAGVTVKK